MPEVTAVQEVRSVMRGQDLYKDVLISREHKERMCAAMSGMTLESTWTCEKTVTSNCLRVSKRIPDL